MLLLNSGSIFCTLLYSFSVKRKIILFEFQINIVYLHSQRMKMYATELVVKTHCSKNVFKFYGIVCWHTFATQTISF